MTHTKKELKTKIATFRWSEKKLVLDLSAKDGRTKEAKILRGAIDSVSIQKEIAERKLAEYAVAG